MSMTGRFDELMFFSSPSRPQFCKRAPPLPECGDGDLVYQNTISYSMETGEMLLNDHLILCDCPLDMKFVANNSATSATEAMFGDSKLLNIIKRHTCSKVMYLHSISFASHLTFFLLKRRNLFSFPSCFSIAMCELLLANLSPKQPQLIIFSFFFLLFLPLSCSFQHAKLMTTAE